mgnify:CR=1 FL=1
MLLFNEELIKLNTMELKNLKILHVTIQLSLVTIAVPAPIIFKNITCYYSIDFQPCYMPQ